MDRDAIMKALDELESRVVHLQSRAKELEQNRRQVRERVGSLLCAVEKVVEPPVRSRKKSTSRSKKSGKKK